MTFYDHLEDEAVQDFEQILQNSLAFGSEIAERTYYRFLTHFDRIIEGRAFGHSRSDIPTRSPVAFIRVRPTQFLIVYNPRTLRVLRILDGRRDLPRILS